MKNIFLSLGSNLGDRKKAIVEAVKLIGEQIGHVCRQSSLYETQPWGKQDQKPFLNLVVQISSDLEPAQILEVIHLIESRLGRLRKEKWGPRVIDIDILYYDACVVQTEQLSLPHPMMEKRKFVLIPLVEIAPDFVHPVLKKSTIQLLDECEDNSEVFQIKG